MSSENPDNKTSPGEVMGAISGATFLIGAPLAKYLSSIPEWSVHGNICGLSATVGLVISAYCVTIDSTLSGRKN